MACGLFAFPDQDMIKVSYDYLTYPEALLKSLSLINLAYSLFPAYGLSIVVTPRRPRSTGYITDVARPPRTLVPNEPCKANLTVVDPFPDVT